MTAWFSQCVYILVKAYEGDAYPLGALPIGTVISSIEMYPGDGAKFARAAGTCSQILRKANGKVYFLLPSKQEVCVSEKCMAVVGRISNPDKNKKIRGSPQMSRWLGYRPKSGWKQKKTGYHGRKIRPPKATRVFDSPPQRTFSVHKLNL